MLDGENRQLRDEIEDIVLRESQSHKIFLLDNPYIPKARLTLGLLLGGGGNLFF